MYGLLDLLEDSAASPAELVFLGLDGSPSRFGAGEFWVRSSRVAGWLQESFRPGEPIAMVLTNSPECVFIMAGALRSGLAIHSLPTPGRGTDLVQYVRDIESICAAAGISTVYIDGLYASALQSDRIRFEPTESASDDHAPGSDSDGTTLVQFTSGSTAAPKGVVLSSGAIAANVLAIIESVGPRPGDNSLSWLPLSHDMGLIGMLLTSVVSGGKRWVNGGTVVVGRPERFLMDPGSWMQQCSDYRISITAGPPFAYEVAGRALSRASQLDLSPLRSCLVGAQLIPAPTLRAFEDAARRHGLADTALSPAYGLAEVAVAVSIVPPTDCWRSIEVSQGQGGIEVVSTGRPLRDIDVAIDEGGIGEIRIASPSLLSGYTTGEPPIDGHGRFRTADVGFLDRGEVMPMGRADEVVVIGGRNLHPQDIEERLLKSLSPRIRRGGIAVLALADDAYAILVEDAEPTGGTSATLAARVDEIATETWGVRPRVSRVLEKGELPKTTSGKLRLGDARALVG